MSNSVSILVVDDEPIIRRYIKKLLSKRGHYCATAASEAEAMRLIDQGFYPESALIDYLIPEGRITRSIDGELYGLTGGLRLAKFIKHEIGERCRIILNTGLAQYRHAAEEGGVWGYLLKPCADFDILFDILGQGFLNENEIGRPTLDINTEIRQRQQMGKEFRR